MSNGICLSRHVKSLATWFFHQIFAKQKSKQVLLFDQRKRSVEIFKFENVNNYYHCLLLNCIFIDFSIELWPMFWPLLQLEKFLWQWCRKMSKAQCGILSYLRPIFQTQFWQKILQRLKDFTFLAILRRVIGQYWGHLPHCGKLCGWYTILKNLSGWKTRFPTCWWVWWTDDYSVLMGDWAAGGFHESDDPFPIHVTIFSLWPRNQKGLFIETFKTIYVWLQFLSLLLFQFDPLWLSLIHWQ